MSSFTFNTEICVLQCYLESHIQIGLQNVGDDG